jgi:hypothetical protein
MHRTGKLKKNSQSTATPARGGCVLFSCVFVEKMKQKEDSPEDHKE